MLDFWVKKRDVFLTLFAPKKMQPPPSSFTPPKQEFINRYYNTVFHFVVFLVFFIVDKRSLLCILKQNLINLLFLREKKI